MFSLKSYEFTHCCIECRATMITKEKLPMWSSMGNPFTEESLCNFLFQVTWIPTIR